MYAKDLVESPKKPPPEGPQRKPPTKVPSWHLTGDATMKYISGVHSRQEAKRKQEEKYDKAKKEAVSKVKSEECKTKKVTRLTSPVLNAKKPKRVTKRK